MFQDFNSMNLVGLAKYTDQQYEDLEKHVADRCLFVNIVYSCFAIALHIAFCIEVFQYEATDSEICSIVASGLFILCHIYNGKANGNCVSCCCILPIFIAGFAISRCELLNVIIFLFQLCLWQGEYYIVQIMGNYEKLKGIREARKSKKANPTNPTVVEHQLEVKIDEAAHQLIQQEGQITATAKQ